MNWKPETHKISTLLDWRKRSAIIIRPDFQRNAVWSKVAKIMLIDSILKDIPMPKIYLLESVSEIDKTETVYSVIDGQQRLLTIFDFIDNNIKLSSPYSGEYLNKKFSDLPIDIKRKIKDYRIDMNILSQASPQDVNELYSRVNRYIVPLNKQELRKADYPGVFIKTAEKLAYDERFANIGIFTAARIRRMLDVEFCEELLAILFDGIQDKKEYIDEFCEKYMVVDDEIIDKIEERFFNIIRDILLIMPAEAIVKTRFRQIADFYSLFSAINKLHNNGFVIVDEKIKNARNALFEMNREISPNSKNEEYMKYAIDCISDANSKNSRVRREKFIYDRIVVAYDKVGNSDNRY